MPQAYDASKEFAGKKVVLVSVPGAFTPGCQALYDDHRLRSPSMRILTDQCSQPSPSIPREVQRAQEQGRGPCSVHCVQRCLGDECLGKGMLSLFDGSIA